MDDRAQRLEVRVCDARGRPATARGLGAWLRRVAPVRTRGTVTVALVSDQRIRALNRAYRRKDDPTDVLSFAAQESARPRAMGRKGRRGRKGGTGSTRAGFPVQPILPIQPIPPHDLGDIVIARGVARRQARAARHSEITELKVLALHGLLHLLGYDHEGDNGRMARAERRLRRKGGLREGLVERSRQ